MKNYILFSLIAVILVSCGHGQSKSASASSQPLNEAKTAIAACKQKYYTHVERVECANPAVIQAYEKAHYPYMDLIQIKTTKDLDIAEHWDKNDITESQAKAAADYVGLQLRTILQERQKGEEADHQLISQAMQNLNNIYSANDASREYNDPRP